MIFVGVDCKVGSKEVVGGGGCEMENFDGVGGGGSNVGTSEVVGGGGIDVVGEVGDERIDFIRVGEGDIVNLETIIVDILFELGEESRVLLSSSNSTTGVR